MASTKDKWMRRFIIPGTTRHKKGFTIYKVTSVVFLKSSHEEISKVSVWKRYNDFKKLHSELSILCARSQIKESYPSFPKPKFFGRFEAEVIEERRECALKFLEFVGRHSYLFSSDIFIKFFETSHEDYSVNDCSESLSSDTSVEDDRHIHVNHSPTDSIVSQSIFEPKVIHSSILPISMSENDTRYSQETCKSKELQYVQLNDTKSKIEDKQTSMTKHANDNLLAKDNNIDKSICSIEDKQIICKKNNNCYEDSNHNFQNDKDCAITQTSSNTNVNTFPADANTLVTMHDGSDLPQVWSDSSQYILVAAAHMNAAFKHEDLTEYEEAFTQYKMGISSLRSGVETDSNKIRAEIIKEKISKYLERAEKLYNRYLNCNISLLSKPISELQHYKVLKILKTAMLVKDVRRNCLNIVKTIEKSPSNKENISNYILRGQVPYMVQLHACIDTETRVFLVLQHLSRGKLWDFITLHYTPSNNNRSCDKIIMENNIEKSVSDSNIILAKNSIKNKIEGTASLDNLKLISTNSKVQMTINPVSVDKKDEIHRDLSTTQLLEKAQILLQSVNATLKESNTVANRLRESDYLNHDYNTNFLNLKNSINQSKNWTEVPGDINKVSLEIDNKSKDATVEKIPEKNVIISIYLSVNDNKKVKSQCSTDNSSLSDSFRDLSCDEKESTSSSTDNLKTADKYITIDHQISDKSDNVTNNFEFKKSIKSYDKNEKNNYYASVDEQIHHGDITMESIKNTMDDDEVLWTIPENVIRLWAAEILLALEALHQQDVVVFDLKPDSILLDDNGHVQLKYVIPTHNIDLLKYKHPYASPELSMFSPMIRLTSATDIWSYGVILYELLVGNKFQMMHPNVFQSHSLLSIPCKLSENAKSLLLNLLKHEPSERLTISEIKQHPFFKEIDWSSLVDTFYDW
nr:ribosomal protein S6 kinase delta-1 [Nomia melanderi]XP_031850034.1 ribosomal protein S6 kinase delta-1 [Nomia melanderi]